MTWTQAEDELVAAGMYRYGLDLDLISRHLMPVKTVKEIRSRQKNRCHRVEGNCLRVSFFLDLLILPAAHGRFAASHHLSPPWCTDCSIACEQHVA